MNLPVDFTTTKPLVTTLTLRGPCTMMATWAPGTDGMLKRGNTLFTALHLMRRLQRTKSFKGEERRKSRKGKELKMKKEKREERQRRSKKETLVLLLMKRRKKTEKTTSHLV